jgi:hypothetical protein
MLRIPYSVEQLLASQGCPYLVELGSDKAKHARVSLRAQVRICTRTVAQTDQWQSEHLINM